MRNKTNDIEVLRKMIDYCNDIEALMDQYNHSFTSYQTDISFQYSCNMCIIQIGELVTRLSDSLLEKHDKIPWYEIKAMRNLHAHDYDNVNFEIVWETLTTDIPELKTNLEYILYEA